jgi:hypothetical protein
MSGVNLQKEQHVHCRLCCYHAYTFVYRLLTLMERTLAVYSAVYSGTNVENTSMLQGSVCIVQEMRYVSFIVVIVCFLDLCTSMPVCRMLLLFSWSS